MALLLCCIVLLLCGSTFYLVHIFTLIVFFPFLFSVLLEFPSEDGSEAAGEESLSRRFLGRFCIRRMQKGREKKDTRIYVDGLHLSSPLRV